MSTERRPFCWTDGSLPVNVTVGDQTVISGKHCFKRFKSQHDPALVIGRACAMDGVHFAIGGQGRIEIGDYCYFTNAALLCDEAIRIGNYVVIGWNTSISDSDFHPIEPALRIQDAVACSPLANGRRRPEVKTAVVQIEDDVWIGQNATILKGVRIGSGAVVEAGAMVTRDVPAGVRVRGNPAQVVEA